VQGRSLRDIWRESLKIRANFSFSLGQKFHIIEFIELVLSRIIPELVFQVWADEELENGILGLAHFWPPEIIMAESAYIQAVNGGSRGRWIAAHELGHIWLKHGLETAFQGPAKSAVRIPTRFSAEFQADEFAAELLMPAAICRTMTVAEIAKIFGVSTSLAKRRVNFIRNH
jgi:hypothetical protein